MCFKLYALCLLHFTLEAFQLRGIQKDLARCVPFEAHLGSNFKYFYGFSGPPCFFSINFFSNFTSFITYIKLKINHLVQNSITFNFKKNTTKIGIQCHLLLENHNNKQKHVS